MPGISGGYRKDRRRAERLKVGDILPISTIARYRVAAKASDGKAELVTGVERRGLRLRHRLLARKEEQA